MKNTQPVAQPAKKQPSDPLAPFTTGTLLAGIRTAPYKILSAVDRFVHASDGMLADELGLAVGIPLPEAHELIRIFRKAMAPRPEDQLDGIVEIDEGVLDLGPAGDKDGSEIMVVVAVEKKSEADGYIALTALEGRIDLPCLAIDTQMIKSGSTVETRRPETYGRALVDRNCKILTVGKTGIGVGSPLLPRCAKVFARVEEVLKNSNRGEITIGIVQEHLNEISFRWNHRLDMKRAAEILKIRLNPKGPGLEPIAVEYRGDPDAMP